MIDWRETLVKLNANATPHVLVTVAGANGSAPREAGAKMIVTDDRLYGSVGGGNLEHKACTMARRMLTEGATDPTLEHFPLGPALGQCCGGQVTLLLEPFRANRFQIVLFGAGHVGRAVIKLLGDLPCKVTWIDSRGGVFPETLPENVVTRPSDALVYDVGEAPAHAYYLVMTHSHAIDRDVTEAVLRRGDFAYCGLIGSRTKRRQFEKRWLAKGLTRAQIGRLTCPIGISGISGKLPAEIAVAVVAQLLSIHETRASAVERPTTTAPQSP